MNSFMGPFVVRMVTSADIFVRTQWNRQCQQSRKMTVQFHSPSCYMTMEEGITHIYVWQVAGDTLHAVLSDGGFQFRSSRRYLGPNQQCIISGPT